MVPGLMLLTIIGAEAAGRER